MNYHGIPCTVNPMLTENKKTDHFVGVDRNQISLQFLGVVKGIQTFIKLAGVSQRLMLMVMSNKVAYICSFVHPCCFYKLLIILVQFCMNGSIHKTATQAGA